MTYVVVEVEAGVPVTGRQLMTEAEWLSVVTGEARVSDFEFPLTEAIRAGKEGA